ncbi:MAG: carboxypeptidase regulatory-like domain-containing protein, partial [Planctomycetota bacterium]
RAESAPSQETIDEADAPEIWVLEMDDSREAGEGPPAGGRRPSGGEVWPGAPDGAVAALEPDRRGEPSEASSGSELSIAGRVLDEEGRPVPGLGVVAARHALHAGEAEPVLSSPPEQRVRTRRDGSYEFGGMEAGDYLIRTVATDRYASARVMALGGSRSADLVVVENHWILVHGTVTDAKGNRLAGVRVIPPDPQGATWSDEDGSYETDLVAQRKGNYAFDFLLEGFQEERINIKGDRLIGLSQKRLDVRLSSAAETTTVFGTLTTERGERIEGEMIRLQSQLLKARYTAVTDRDGSFSIPDVKVGSDYSVMVLPKGPYQPHTERGVVFTGQDALLEIVLGALGTGRLSGRMLDAEGNPLPDFTLWLQSTRNPANRVPVTADRAGGFVVENAPEGRLLFITRSAPRLEVQGIELGAGEDKEVDLVLDRGDHELRGSVLDDRGEPVAGATLTLRWVLHGGGTRSASTRRTVTDKSGSFGFTQLGPGRHDLDVGAAGYQNVQESVEVGPYAPETEIRLDPRSE